MGLYVLLEAQLGCKTGIFSVSHFWDLLYTDLWHWLYCCGMENTVLSIGKDKEGNVFVISQRKMD